MGTLEIVQVGDPVLRQTARQLSKDELASAEIQELIGHMRDTMRAAPGVGLAAPQIGISLAIAVIEDPSSYHEGFTPEDLAARERSPVDYHVIVNPKLRFLNDETVEHFEGCLSFAGFSMAVSRARKVHVDCVDENGKARSIDASGWYARILQHEIDHLHGIVCCDRADTRTLSTSTNFPKFVAGKTVRDAKAVFGPRPKFFTKPS